MGKATTAATSSGGLMKVLLALVVMGLLVVGGVVALVVTQTSDGGSVELITGLEAEYTAGVVGVSRLQALGAQLAAAIARLPEGVRKGLPADAAGLAKRLGFDPATTEGWRTIGLDATAGVAVVIDTRVTRETGRGVIPVPILLAHITDLDALLAFVKRKGVHVTVGQRPGPWRSFKAGGKEVLIGTRDDQSAILVVPSRLDDAQRVALTARFASFLAPTGARLGDAPAFQKGFKELRSGGAVFSWGGTAPALAAFTALNKNSKSPVLMGFYAAMITGVAVHGSEAGVVARAVTSDTGHLQLAKVLRPTHAGPNFAAHIPRKGWAVMRLAVNLDEGFDGVAQLAPPTLSSRQKAALGGAKGLVALVTGIGWAEFASALSGHVCVAADVASISATAMSKGRTLPRALVMLGVREADKADALLAKLVTRLRDVPGVSIEEIEIAGNKGYALAMGPVRAQVIRAAGMLVAAESGAALKAALEREAGESLAGTAMAAALDDNVAASIGLDLTPLLDLAPLALASMHGQALTTASSTLKDLREALGKGEPYSFMTLKLDGDGLVLAGHVPGGGALALPAVVGVLAAVAVPQFTRYQRRAQAFEARAMLNAIKVGAAAYYTKPRADPTTGDRLPCRFPPSVGATPSAAGCCDKRVDADGDGRCDVNPGAWKNATWTGLRFSMTDQHYFTYTFESSGEGPTAKFTATANADLDCDGTFSTFQLVGTAKRGTAGDDCEMGSSSIFTDQETE